MSIYGGAITSAGKKLLAGLVAGQTIEFTKVQFGSGAVPDGTDLETVTHLYNYVADGSSNIPVVVDSAIHIVAEYRNERNPNLQNVFWINEFGIFAKTDSADEAMIYYASLGDTPQPVNPYVDQRIDVKRYPVTIAVSVNPDIKLAYNPGTFITEENVDLKVQAAMQGHVNNNSNPHKVTKSQIGLGNVDNTSDANKTVKAAGTADTAKKLNNGLVITLDGGSTEGFNKCTFDGSTQKTFNINAKRIAALPALESSTHPGCYYFNVDGETEWINPPMVQGVKYRTMERYFGCPVYTMILETFILDSDRKDVTGDIFNRGVQFIRAEAYAKEVGQGVYHTLPIIRGFNSEGVATHFGFSVSSNGATFTHNDLDKSYHISLQVWYFES